VHRTSRAAAALLVLLAFLFVPTLQVCAGWAGTASDRHACCATAEHGPGARAADACCAAGEHRQHGEALLGALAIAPPSMVATWLPAPPTLPDVRPLDAQVAPSCRSSAETRLLLSVFLI